MNLIVKTPRVFVPLLSDNRYKAIYGGRGSGKSHFGAESLVLETLENPIRVVCLREIQRSIKDSVKMLIEDKIRKLGIEKHYIILEHEIRGRNGSLIIFRGLQNHTADSIKSLEGFDRAWVEEAQTLSFKSLHILRPTLRNPNSQLLFTWNPTNAADPVDEFFRGEHPPQEATIVRANWYDNPFFPDVLRKEMMEDKERDPNLYAHIWQGEYRRYAEGSIYAKFLAEARDAKRICPVPYNPSYPVYTAWDFGFGDATAIWFAQIVGREVRIIDYYECNKEPLSHYARIVQDKPYEYILHILPHDAGNKRVEGCIAEQLINLGIGRRGKNLYEMGNSSVNYGISAGRSLIAQCYFDENKCKYGLRALSDYHWEYDEVRRITHSRPYHDWSSNGADAFRYLAVYLANNVGKLNLKAQPATNDFYEGTGRGYVGGAVWVG